MHDKYPNGKKDDYYHKDKYPNEKYMGIHSNNHHDVYPDNKYPDGHYTGYRHDKYPGGKYPDRHYKGSHHDKYPSDYLHDKKHIRPHSHHGRLGGTDSLVEFGLPVSDVGRGIRRGGLTGLFDDVVGVPGRRSRAGGLFSGSIPDHSVGIARGLLDVGPFSSSRRHGHIHLPHKGNDYDNKYPHGPQHKNHKYETYPKKDYKYSTGQTYETYHKKDYKHKVGHKYETYPKKDYKHSISHKYETYPKKDTYPKTHIGSGYPPHGTMRYPKRPYDAHSHLYGDMKYKKKDYKIHGDNYKKVKSKKTY